jgi:hypothetical protein
MEWPACAHVLNKFRFGSKIFTCTLSLRLACMRQNLNDESTSCIRQEEEEEFITSGNWRGKHISLSRGAGADQP